MQQHRGRAAVGGRKASSAGGVAAASSPAAGVGRIAVLALAAAALAGCSSVPDIVNPVSWYRSATGLSANDPAPDARNTKNLAAGGERPYPNLASVPGPPDYAMSSAERDALTKSLAADRANAHYTDEAVRTGSAPLAALPPAAGTTPSPGAAAGSPDTAAPSSSASAGGAPSAAAPASSGGNRLVAGGAVPGGSTPAPAAASGSGPGRRGAVAPGSEPPPQEAALESPDVRSVPEPETPRNAPPAPGLAGAAPAAAAAAPAGPIAEVTFPENSAALPSDERQRLASVVPRQRGGVFRVIGYAGRGQGGDTPAAQLASFNMALDRANAVARALAESGVPSSRIMVEAAPPVTDGAEAGRRAEIFVED